MGEEEYLKNRLDDQIKWYESKSATNKKKFHYLKISEIIISISVPLLAGYIDEFYRIKFLIGIMSYLVAIIAGLIVLLRYNENWVSYRTTAESLKHEKYMYLTHSGPYKETTNFNLLVERVESLISKENSNWTQIIVQQEKKQKVGNA